jgi:transcriptional regulator with XRE-family HTH domain
MFYEKYQKLCHQIGKSPFAVARDLGISSRTQGNWKSGSEPRYGTLKRIADYFNVDVSYFYEDDQIENNDDKIVEKFIDELKRDLTDDEQLLLDMFRTMTDEQKNALMKEAMRIKLK